MFRPSTHSLPPKGAVMAFVPSFLRRWLFSSVKERESRLGRSRRAAKVRPRLEHLEDRTLLATTLVSTGANGIGNLDSQTPSISADGRYVAFLSLANNLLAANTNGVQEVYLKDTQTGAVSLVSSGVNGPGNN